MTPVVQASRPAVTFVVQAFRPAVCAGLKACTTLMLLAVMTIGARREPLRSRAAVPHPADRALRHLLPSGRRPAGAAAGRHRRRDLADAPAHRSGVTPPRRTHVVLADQTDLANGWATPLPYNTIVVNAVLAVGRRVHRHFDDWLRLVFTHEFTHIVHLDRSEGWARSRAIDLRTDAARVSQPVPAGLADRRDRDLSRRARSPATAGCTPATSARSCAKRRGRGGSSRSIGSTAG